MALNNWVTFEKTSRMKATWGILVVTATFLGISCQNRQTPAPETAPQKPPNIIVILTDDQGYRDVGFNGCTDIPTPNIDRIATNGAVFTNGYVSYPVCGPSRAGLLTGRYQDRFGFSRNPLFAPKDPGQGLPVDEETMADLLHKKGYRTMAIGKWHLGAHESQRPLKRGFDEFFGFLTGGHRYFPEDWTLEDISQVDSQGAAYRTKLLKNDQRVEETEYLTDALSREAVSFVSRNAKNPFFLYLAYNAPHTPLQATPKYLDRFPTIQDRKRKTYAAMVSAVDDGVGNLLDQLEQLGIEDNTMVFFLSDNGGPEEHNGSDNGPLRGGKSMVYEGGIHVPFAVQWPSIIPKGAIYGQPVISLDIFATAAAVSGAAPKNPIDGIDLIPYLQDSIKTPPHASLFWRQYDSRGFAVRNGNLKLVDNKGEGIELHDLGKDIGETDSLADPEIKDKLQNEWDHWNANNKNPVFLGLMENEAYNKIHPDRFTDGEKY